MKDAQRSHRGSDKTGGALPCPKCWRVAGTLYGKCFRRAGERELERRPGISNSGEPHKRNDGKSADSGRYSITKSCDTRAAVLEQNVSTLVDQLIPQTW